MKKNNIRGIYENILELYILENESEISLQKAWEKDDPHRSAVLANLNPKFVRSLYYLLCDSSLRLEIDWQFRAIDPKTPSHYWSNTILRAIFFCYGIDPYKIKSDEEPDIDITRILYEISDCQIRINLKRSIFETDKDVDKIISILDETKEYIKVMKLIWEHNNIFTKQESRISEDHHEAGDTIIRRYITDIGLQKIIGGSKGTVKNTIYREFKNRTEIDKSLLEDRLLSEHSLLTENKIKLNYRKKPEKTKAIKIEDINEWLSSNNKVLSTNFYRSNQTKDIVYDFEGELSTNFYRSNQIGGQWKKEEEPSEIEAETFAIGNVIRGYSLFPKNIKKEKLLKELSLLLKNDTEKVTPISSHDRGTDSSAQDKVKMMVLESDISLTSEDRLSNSLLEKNSIEHKSYKRHWIKEKVEIISKILEDLDLKLAPNLFKAFKDLQVEKKRSDKEEWGTFLGTKNDKLKKLNKTKDGTLLRNLLANPFLRVIHRNPKLKDNVAKLFVTFDNLQKSLKKVDVIVSIINTRPNDLKDYQNSSQHDLPDIVSVITEKRIRTLGIIIHPLDNEKRDEKFYEELKNNYAYHFDAAIHLHLETFEEHLGCDEHKKEYKKALSSIKTLAKRVEHEFKIYEKIVIGLVNLGVISILLKLNEIINEEIKEPVNESINADIKEPVNESINEDVTKLAFDIKYLEGHISLNTINAHEIKKWTDNPKAKLLTQDDAILKFIEDLEKKGLPNKGLYKNDFSFIDQSNEKYIYESGAGPDIRFSPFPWLVMSKYSEKKNLKLLRGTKYDESLDYEVTMLRQIEIIREISQPY